MKHKVTITIEVSGYEAAHSGWTDEELEDPPMRPISEYQVIDVLLDRLFAIGPRYDDTGVEVDRVRITNDQGQVWDHEAKRWVDG